MMAWPWPWSGRQRPGRAGADVTAPVERAWCGRRRAADPAGRVCYRAAADDEEVLVNGLQVRPDAGRLSLARLIERYGPDAGLPTADPIGDCPRRDAGLYERCDLYWPQLTEWF
jgi:hypothetical protein